MMLTNAHEMLYLPQAINPDESPVFDHGLTVPVIGVGKSAMYAHLL